MRRKGVAALPSHLVVRLRFAGLVVLALHHVEHVSLGVQLRHFAFGVVGADDVQVVVEPHLHSVVVPVEPAVGGGGGGAEGEKSLECWETRHGGCSAGAAINISLKTCDYILIDYTAAQQGNQREVWESWD